MNDAPKRVITVHPVELVPAEELTTDQILHRMEIMLERDMLVHAAYVSDDVEDEELAAAGAVCGGHRACAVGHLWIAAGVQPVITPNEYQVEGVVELPGVWPISDRDDFLAARPPLREAYDALNEAADDWAISAGMYGLRDAYGNTQSGCYGGALEILFEEYGVGADTLTEVVQAARRKVAA